MGPNRAASSGAEVLWHRHWVETHDSNVHVEPDEIVDERPQPFGLAIRKAKVDDKTLPQPIAALAEATFQSVNQPALQSPAEVPTAPHAVHPPRLLRLGSERRGQRSQREPAEERAPVHHSIT